MELDHTSTSESVASLDHRGVSAARIERLALIALATAVVSLLADIVQVL
jgi:hypothetical protein